jgi:anti-anti-sigma factor
MLPHRVREGLAPVWNEKPRIEVRSADRGALVLALLGDHDLATKPMVMEALAGIGANTAVVIDLTRCTFLDSTVIGVLLGAGPPEGWSVSLVLPPDTSYVTRALSVIGMRDLVAMHPSVDAALASSEAGRPGVTHRSSVSDPSESRTQAHP